MQICDSDSEDENAETANDVNINSVTPSENMLTNNTERVRYIYLFAFHIYVLFYDIVF